MHSLKRVNIATSLWAGLIPFSINLFTALKRFKFYFYSLMSLLENNRDYFAGKRYS